MNPKPFSINEYIELLYDNEIWTLYVQGEPINLEAFLDRNSKPDICNKIKKIMADELSPIENPPSNVEKKTFQTKKDLKPSNEIYSQPEDIEEEAPKPKKGEVRFLDILNELIDEDLVMIFGKTGTGKTSLAIKAAIEAKEEKKTVIYIDVEKNIPKKKKDLLKNSGVNYVTVESLDELDRYIEKLPKYDLVIVDSLGLPTLSAFIHGGMKGQGMALLKMQGISDNLKKYTSKNGSLGIVINQPESDMNKDSNIERRSFGDKNEYYYKEILLTKFAVNGRKPDKTTIVLKAYRSRSCGMGTNICSAEITNSGTKIIQ